MAKSLIADNSLNSVYYGSVFCFHCGGNGRAAAIKGNNFSILLAAASRSHKPSATIIYLYMPCHSTRGFRIQKTDDRGQMSRLSSFEPWRVSYRLRRRPRTRLRPRTRRRPSSPIKF